MKLNCIYNIFLLPNPRHGVWKLDLISMPSLSAKERSYRLTAVECQQQREAVVTGSSSYPIQTQLPINILPHFSAMSHGGNKKGSLVQGCKYQEAMWTTFLPGLNTWSYDIILFPTVWGRDAQRVGKWSTSECSRNSNVFSAEEIRVRLGATGKPGWR